MKILTYVSKKEAREAKGETIKKIQEKRLEEMVKLPRD
jgi:hypothetical protein